MKKIYIALAVIGTALLSSCVQEKSISEIEIGENTIVVSLQGAPATRSAEMLSVQKGEMIEFTDAETSQTFFLEETIEDLNRAWAPITRGTPAFTENLGILYKSDLGVYAEGLGDKQYWKDGDMSPRKGEGNEEYADYGTGSGWRYNYSYDSDPWKTKDNYDFYFRMPLKPSGVKTDDDGKPILTYAKSGNKLTITFTYTSPLKAEDQQDILFAARNVTKEAHLNSLPNGIPVLFNHALTGVKFAIANPDEAMITSVKFTGLAGTGTCTITPANEGGNYTDDITDYSSADAVNWGTPTVVPGAEYTATFEEVVSYSGGSFTNNGDYPNSFKGAGSAMMNNLNDGDATQTFWFIPQKMTNAVQLEITYTWGDDTTPHTTVIDFGKSILKNNADTYWYAGQLRTYTLRVNEVNVRIDDKVTIQNADVDPDDDEAEFGPYEGSYKDNVVITNTGTTDAYIRAAIIGQWLDSSGNPVFGFTDFTASADEQFVIVDSWYQDQFSPTGNHTHGAFKNLVGYKNDTTNGTPGSTVYTSNWWIKGSDGYYYFKYVVPAGKAVPAQDSSTKYIYVTSTGTSNPTGTADPLFDSYTIKQAPDARVAGKVEDIYFELEIATQAISAKNLDGSYCTLAEAWAKAGITVTE